MVRGVKTYKSSLIKYCMFYDLLILFSINKTELVDNVQKKITMRVFYGGR